MQIETIINSPILFEYSSKKIKIFAGGNKDNLFFNSSSKHNEKQGWVVSGIGLKSNNVGNTIFKKEDWSDHLDILNNIDGHFVAVKWNEERIIFESDPLGLRDIYISESKSNIIFTTRVDWLAKSHELKINFNEFGSRWLLFNQITDNSVFHGVERIVSGKKATVALNGYDIKHYNSNWLPDEKSKNIDIENYSENLKSLIYIGNRQTLGLSGGMDSRVILSYLLEGNSSWDTFTFGNPKHPDSLISQFLVNDYNIEHTQYHAGLPPIENLIAKIKDYSIQSIVNNGVSAIYQSLNYSSMNNQHSILIDGCLGEIWRREFFYRLYFNGKKSILNKDTKSIIPNISHPHADIFTEEINNLMTSSLEDQIHFWFENLPPVEKIGIENWIDLFALKTRMPNYFSHEQTIIDDVVTSIMPFAQMSLIKNLFNIPISLRKNGKLFKTLIKTNFPSLEKYSLVKGSSINPYNFNSLQSRILNQFRKKFNRNIYKDNSRDQLLNILKPYILDISSSVSFKNSGMYDHKKVKEIIESYYNGNLNYGYSLDWWLSFELFRQNLA